MEQRESSFEAALGLLRDAHQQDLALARQELADIKQLLAQSEHDSRYKLRRFESTYVLSDMKMCLGIR
jgi:hypothetical protein